MIPEPTSEPTLDPTPSTMDPTFQPSISPTLLPTTSPITSLSIKDSQSPTTSPVDVLSTESTHSTVMGMAQESESDVFQPAWMQIAAMITGGLLCCGCNIAVCVYVMVYRKRKGEETEP